MREEGRKGKIKEFEKHFQFMFVLTLFFPVVVEAIFNFDGSDNLFSSGVLLRYSLIPFFFVATYLIWVWRKEVLFLRSFDHLRWLQLSYIASFCLFFLTLAYTPDVTGVEGMGIYFFAFALSFNTILWIPMMMVVYLILEMSFSEFKNFKDDVRCIRKKKSRKRGLGKS